VHAFGSPLAVVFKHGDGVFPAWALLSGKGDDVASVLIVDDDRGTRETWTVVLRHEGFDVAAAATGGEGLAQARAKAFDAILVDFRLPDLSGTEVVRALRRDGVGARMVIVTAFPTFDSSFDAGFSGADGYVDGPLLGEEVVDIVRQAAAGGLPVRHPGRRNAARPRPASAVDPRIRETMKMIEANLASPPSSDVCAATVGLSASGLRHLFRRSLGMSLTRYGMERRLQVVSVRLREGFERIEQIAYDVGFRSGSLREFRREFRRRFGMSPTAYRALCRRGRPVSK
jgi:two-component system OmpR family response regulator